MIENSNKDKIIYETYFYENMFHFHLPWKGKKTRGVQIWNIGLKWINAVPQQIFACSKSTIGTLEKELKYVQV